MNISEIIQNLVNKKQDSIELELSEFDLKELKSYNNKIVGTNLGSNYKIMIDGSKLTCKRHVGGEAEISKLVHSLKTLNRHKCMVFSDSYKIAEKTFESKDILKTIVDYLKLAQDSSVRYKCNEEYYLIKLSSGDIKSLTVYTVISENLTIDKFFTDYVKTNRTGLLLANNNTIINNKHLELLCESLKDRYAVSCTDKFTSVLINSSSDIQSAVNADFDIIFLDSSIPKLEEILISIIQQDKLAILLTGNNSLHSTFSANEIILSNSIINNALLGSLVAINNYNNGYSNEINYISVDVSLKSYLKTMQLTSEILELTSKAMKSEIRFNGKIGQNTKIEEELYNILKIGIDNKADDISLSVNNQPQYRVFGRLQPLPDCPEIKMTPQRMTLIYNTIVKDERSRRIFDEKCQLDTTYSVSGLGRFRVSAYLVRSSIAFSLRHVPSEPIPWTQLGIPKSFIDEVIKKYTKGLILITGSTHSGKSTIMNSLYQWYNLNKEYKIITIEDPIEVIHTSKKCLIEQRDVGVDCISYGDALKQALRSDPNIIGIGEMRDKEVVSTVLKAVRSGHIVISTFHTPNGTETINAILNMFPEDSKEEIRSILAEDLCAIYSQQLLPSIQGKQVPAVEITINTPSVKSNILGGSSLHTAIMNGGTAGMMCMDTSIANLYRTGKITEEIALNYAHDKTLLTRLLKAGD